VKSLILGYTVLKPLSSDKKLGRLWCCISKVSLLEVFLRMIRNPQEIFIASDQPERGSATEVITVIHEIAHHTSGAEDLKQAHSPVITQVAARV
jgi:hypothetical protein